MKKILLFLVLHLFLVPLNAAIVKWDGGGDGISWNDPFNWVNNTVPSAGDEVVLDNSSLSSNFIVRLPDIAVTFVNLKISPSSTFIIKLWLPPSNVISTGALITTGSGYTIVIDNGAVFENNASVSSGTNLSIADSIRINNGGRYLHRTRSGYAGWIGRLSKLNGTETGNFEFDVPFASFLLSLSGRTYGNLILSSTASGGSITYSGSGAIPVAINGGLSINTGVNFTTSMSADFIIKGDLVQDSNSVFNIQTSGNNNFVKLRGNFSSAGSITETGTGQPVLEMDGISNQLINITGSIQNQVTVKINNGNGMTLANDLVVPFRIEFVVGKIYSSPGAVLCLPDGSSYSGASPQSFVEGPVRKKGDDNFIFPVGAGSTYAPLGMFNISGQTVTDEFTAQYFRANPQPVYGPGVGAGLDHVSNVEYWKFDQNTGNTIKKISLDVHVTSFCYVLTNTYVARWNGMYWVNEGSTNSGIVSIPPFETGTITSVNDITVLNENAFTLSTDLPYSANPLPVDDARIRLSRPVSKHVIVTGIYPNPIIREALIRIFSRYEEKVSITILNSSGIRITYFEDRLHRGINKIPITLRVPPGKYIAEVISSGSRITIPIIKQ